MEKNNAENGWDGGKYFLKTFEGLYFVHIYLEQKKKKKKVKEKERNFDPAVNILSLFLAYFLI